MTKEKSPLPSMRELTDYLNAQSGGVSKRDIARVFHIKGDNRAELRDMLKILQKNGTIARDRSARHYRVCVAGRLPEHCQIEITGEDSMGDLLARPFEWESTEVMPQIVIVKNKINPPAGIGDIVQAKVKYVGNRLYEGEVLRLITHGDNQMVGVYENGKVFSVDRRIAKPFEMIDVPRSVKNRDIIIFDAPMRRTRNAVAKFVERIGSADEKYAPTIMAIYMHKIPVMFSEQTEKQATHLSVPSADDNRIDLQSVPFITIDGADARDFDDAVWAEPDTDSKNAGGFHIMVGIADVAWYVRGGTALDRDAWTRGNSVYFPDRVIPMLPFELSNGVCSLNPNEPRASLVCEAWIDKNGKKIKHRFKRALIRSVRRLTYDEVQEALDGKQPIVGLETQLDALKNAYTLLKKQRDKRGVMEIDVPEPEIRLNEKGEVVSIRNRVQTTSMKLIEELMILANVSAAETLEEKGYPTMYRVHDKPSAEKLTSLNSFLASIGFAGKHPFTENSRAKDFNAVLTKAEGSGKDFAINEFILRSQSQAMYSPENIGHFGLSLERYAHFTSPIRRYADIMVHRALISALKLGDGGLSEEERATFERTAQHISYTERQAASAERDADDRYTAQFLNNKIGKTFDAQISSVTGFGLFLRLRPYNADAFLPMRFIGGDHYEYDDESKQLIGRATGKVYKVGDEMRVLLKDCDAVTGSLEVRPVSKSRKY